MKSLRVALKSHCASGYQHSANAGCNALKLPCQVNGILPAALDYRQYSRSNPANTWLPSINAMPQFSSNYNSLRVLAQRRFQTLSGRRGLPWPKT
jgi:hypothetical protein